MVGTAMIGMLGWFLVAVVFRWPFQFGIRTLLLLVVVVAAVSWFAVELKDAREQIAAIGRVRAAGGTVGYDFDYEHLEELPDQDWIRRVVGRDFFDIVVAVENPPTGK